MEQEINRYINNLIHECLTVVPSLDRNQLEGYINQVVFETLVYSLSDDQVKGIEDMDFNSPAGIGKLQLLAASTPGFMMILDEVLRKEVEHIKQSGQIPPSVL